MTFNLYLSCLNVIQEGGGEEEKIFKKSELPFSKSFQKNESPGTRHKVTLGWPHRTHRPGSLRKSTYRAKARVTSHTPLHDRLRPLVQPKQRKVTTLQELPATERLGFTTKFFLLSHPEYFPGHHPHARRRSGVGARGLCNPQF